MIYVSSACIKGNKISEIITKYAENGIRNIELSGGTKYYEGIADDLCRLKEKYDLKYVFHAYFPPPQEDFVINLASCNDMVYERSISHYMSCIEMMKKAGCDVLSLHAGFFVEIKADEIGKALSKTTVYDKERAMKRFCIAYEKIKKECMKNDIRLYLENNVLSAANYETFGGKDLLMMTNFETFIELKQMLDFELLLDLGHLHVSANTLGLDYEKECRLFAPYVKWLHLSHNNGVADEHRPLGKESPVVEMYQKIFKNDVDITLETTGELDEILQSIDVIQ